MSHSEVHNAGAWRTEHRNFCTDYMWVPDLRPRATLTQRVRADTPERKEFLTAWSSPEEVVWEWL